jgi:hypothetical protein
MGRREMFEASGPKGKKMFDIRRTMFDVRCVGFPFEDLRPVLFLYDELQVVFIS